MNIFTSLLGRLGKKAVSSPPGTWVSLTGGAEGVNERNLLQANKEWVFIATDKNATSAAGVRYKVMRYERNGDDVEVFEGPLVDFLEKPMEGFTGKDFIYLNTAWKELTGNAFYEIKGRGRYSPLLPNRVAPVVSGGVLTSIRYTDDTKQRVIPFDKFLHDRYVDPARPYWGAGKLARIARWVDTSTYVGEFLSRFFVNGATFGGFVETEEESEARIKLIKLGLQNDHVGVANAHKIGVLPKGSKFSKTTANMAEMEMGATDDRYRDKILAAFGIPKTLVGLTTEVNRASAEASEYIYAKYTLLPIVTDFVEFLNTDIAPALDSSGRYYFHYDDFVPEDKELKVRERESALGKRPYKTVNEVRAEIGLPPVEGGDIIPEPLAPDMTGSPDEPPSPPPAPKKGVFIKKRAMPRQLRQTLKTEDAFDSLAKKLETIVTAHHDADAESHKKFVARAEDHEKLIAGKVRDFNNRQERDVQLRLKHIVKAVKKGDIFDFEQEVGVLVDFVGPLLKTLMLEQLTEAYLEHAFPGEVDIHSPRISATVVKAARRLAKSYNTTTARLLADALNAGISKGEGLDDLTNRVRQVYEFSDKVRAARVAQTETFYIANEGSREAYRQSGVVKSVRWYTAEDERVCPFCGPQDGKIIGINEVFYPKGHTLEGADGSTMKLDYRAIDVPPLHPSCRCFIRPESIEL